MRRPGEVGKGVAEGEGVRGLNQHERHAWAKKDDVSTAVVCKMFSLEVPARQKKGEPNDRGL